ncbi:MAG: dephospho-CoA kinase [Haliscomenobacteraceae bacterium CHB4]|nr:Dephospho-CoA kinase [Saprospiraceae bacterium]MCE7923491.1 dephospho-CoA kinase [Haliscomenobacteraceae bacterium CHB4]
MDNNPQSAIRNPQPPCLRVGITGGIGSGKTTVCRIFGALGIPVYYADEWAKWLIGHDETIKKGIIEIFSAAAYSPEGEYDRAYVARIVFENKEKLGALNALVHPAVERHSRQWHEQQAKTGVPYTLREAALMIESGSYQFLDYLIVVTAPKALRIQRVMQRDDIPEEQVRARMASQMPEEKKVELADFVIVNDGVRMLIPQVWQIHRVLCGRVQQPA